MKNILTALLLLLSATGIGQRFFSKEAQVKFFSKTKLENIDATNLTGACVVDAGTAAIEFSVLMKGFTFKKALMQEHFNENYVESDKYPKSTFKGTLKNGPAAWDKDGEYEATATGTLTLHGVTKPITTPVHISIKNGVASATTTFAILLQDYNISIPALVTDNISKTVQVTINVPSFKKLN